MDTSRARVISGPFDARHVGGVSVGGASISFGSALASSEREEKFERIDGGSENGGHAPRRSHTVAESRRRPSVRLRSSLNRLRARSSEGTGDVHRRRDVFLEEGKIGEEDGQGDVAPLKSLRKKTSSSRFWLRVHQDAKREKDELTEGTQLKSTQTVVQAKEGKGDSKEEREVGNPYMYRGTGLPPPPPPPPPLSETKTNTTISQYTNQQSHPTPASRILAHTHHNTPRKPPLPVRPKRADSGTAIAFDDVPMAERPLGFKEIAALPSLEERLRVYRRTREYWAGVDHGLGEWVGRAGRMVV